MGYRSGFVLFVMGIFMATGGCTQMASGTDLPTKYWVYVGGNNDGIKTFQLDTAAGTLTDTGMTTPSTNAGFFNFTPDKKVLIAGVADKSQPDGKQGAVESFSVDAKTGKLTSINQQSSQGDESAFVSTDPSGKVVMTVNYMSHTIAVLPLAADGKLSPATCVITTAGHLGPNKDRQEQPHTHSINCDPTGKFALVCDLGTDKILIYKLDVATGQLTPNDPAYVAVPPSSGPRHLIFSADGKFVYEINELNGTVGVFSWDGNKGTLTPVQMIWSLADDFNGVNRAAEVQIDPSGKFLYASNRDDTNYITIFSVDKSSGKLTLVGREPSLGHIPRNFRIDPTGQFMIVANQGDKADPKSTVVMFKIDQQTGKLTKVVGPLPAGNQSICVKILAVEQ